MATPAERMSAMRLRRRSDGLREIRLIVPDARAAAVQERVARAVANLDRDIEAEALAWIENVADLDGGDAA